MEYREPISLDGAIKMYINNVSCYCSKRTIEYYRENLYRFQNFILNETDMILPFSDDITIYDINNEVIQLYIQFLRNKDIKNVSINTYMRAIRGFNNYLIEKKYIDVNWFDSIKKLRNDSSPVMVLTEAEYNDIVKYLYMNDNASRNVCIFRLLCDCGLRLNEVIKLDISDIYDTYLVVRNSKYNKNRFVPLPRILYESICVYVGHRRIGPVFLTRTGERITKAAVTKMFTNIKIDLKYNHVHAHQLRHTFATSYVAGGGNLEVLRLLLGHSELMITQNYLHLAQEIMITGIDIHKLDDIFFVNYRNIR